MGNLTKICSKCKVQKSNEYFHKSKNGLYKTKSICKICSCKKSNHDIELPFSDDESRKKKKEIDTLIKICSKCKVEFEKNNINFFEKKDSYIIKDGTEKHFKKLTSVCRGCHNKMGSLHTRMIRCKELNCTVDEYKQKYLEIKAIKRVKILEAKHIKNYPLLLRRVAKGYVFTTINQYKIDRENNFFRMNYLKRKINYPKCSRISDLTKQERNDAKSKYNNTELPRAVIANRLRLKLSECPNEIIEQQRLIIQINQILNK